MKIIKILILVFTLVADAHFCFAEYYPTALVSEEYAEFTIQIEPEKKYTWYNSAISKNSVEYEFQIHLKKYAFGFFIYNSPYNNDKTGSIDDLLDGGQIDIWKIEGNTASRVDNDHVSIKFSLPIPMLKLIIEDKATIKLLFGERPKEVGFTVFGFKTPIDRGYLTVKYK